MQHQSILRHAARCLGLTGMLLFAPLSAFAGGITDSTVIETGVLIQDLNVSGKTVEEARRLLNEHMKSLGMTSLRVTFNESHADTTLTELGMTCDTEAILTQAASYGKTGPLISRYKEKVDLQYENTSIPVICQYDESAVRRFVQADIAALDDLPVDATLTREDGEFIVEGGTAGMVTDVEATVTAILKALAPDSAEDTAATASNSTDVSAADTPAGDTDDPAPGRTVAAVVALTQPRITREMLSAVGDKLGTYSTDYSSSSWNRKTNVNLAAGRLNGQILLPGESLSVSETILSRTPENGYKLAPQYANGATEDSYGGGVCQVSTTLFNAVIRAELRIDRRFCHSMVVHYVPYASDAAISEGNKDFIFTNNTDYPIYIASSANNETLTFSIYGKETRPAGRSIEFVSRTLSEEYMEPEIVYDDDEYEDYEEESGSSSPSVTASLTKVVYQNGVEVSRTLMHTDTYYGSHKIITKGTMPRESEAEDDDQEEPSRAPESTRAPEPEEEESSEEMIDPPEGDEYDD